MQGFITKVYDLTFRNLVQVPTGVYALYTKVLHTCYAI